MTVKPTYDELKSRVTQLDKALERAQWAEDRLKEMQTLYGPFSEDAEHPVFTVDTEGRFHFLNPFAAKAVGGKRKTLIGKTMWDLFPKTVADRQMESVRTTAAGGRVQVIEMPTKVRRSTRWYRTLLFPTQVEDGELPRVLGIAYDITPENVVVQGSPLGVERFKQIVDVLPQFICYVDRNQTYRFVNECYRQAFGLDPEDVVGRKIHDVIGAKAYARTLPHHKRALHGEQVTYSEELEYPDSSIHHIEGCLIPDKDDEGATRGYWGALHDVTTSHQARAVLQESEALLLERERELELRNLELKELNITLNILLDRGEQDRHDLEEKVLHNVRALAFPYLNKLRRTSLNEVQHSYLDILTANIQEIVSPFSRNLAEKFMNLTPKEIEIAVLVKEGKTSKEIAKMLQMAKRTVEAHRDRLRRKLGLTHKRANLRTHLLTLQ